MAHPKKKFSFIDIIIRSYLLLHNVRRKQINRLLQFQYCRDFLNIKNIKLTYYFCDYIISNFFLFVK